MEVAFAAPGEAADREEPDGLVLIREVQSLQLLPGDIQIIHLEEEHAVVDPVPHVGILQVKAKAADMEVGELFGKDTLLEAQVMIEAARDLEVDGPDKGTDTFG